MVLVFSRWCVCMCPFRSLLNVLWVFVRLQESLLACTPSPSRSSVIGQNELLINLEVKDSMTEAKTTIAGLESTLTLVLHC